MTNPITPPPELVGQWLTKAAELGLLTPSNSIYLATQAAQWGADQELWACCHWLFESDYDVAPVGLRAARRPKARSLKEQALDELAAAERLYPADWSTIRRALEALDD